MVARGAVLKMGVEARDVRLERDGDAVAALDGWRNDVRPNDIVRVGQVGVVKPVGVQDDLGGSRRVGGDAAVASPVAHAPKDGVPRVA